MTTGTGTGGSGSGSGGSGGSGPPLHRISRVIAWGIQLLLMEIAYRFPRRAR